ncbi:hypothetical protein [Nocardioides pocheonensis]|uniref:Uncharacterized protein n=1 Tax=Nocardioides pocheonensis TaxID=661485 RepID=A0A3N0GIG9_9ACTN|nr:hypothetical protein [Nocardioides pocheonensis]RNM12229.1 hypothetical protein EFL26_20745 [Nocardioides pocheonensis]
MAEASIDGMGFFDGANAGGAFRLSEAAQEDASETIDAWRIELRAGSQIVVARGKSGANYELVRDEALAAANKGLDLMCLRGAPPLAIRHAAAEHVAWWSERSESVIRLLSAPTITLGAPKVTVTGGVPVLPPVPVWQESARYFRLSQLTDDLFDSFRNVYLALESILDSLTPQRTVRPKEGEGEWFRRALTEADKVVGLVAHAPEGAADPVEALYDELYSSTRNLVFHAKSTRAYLLPHSSSQRRAVEETTRRAARLYLALAQEVIHLRPSMSGWFAGFWRQSLEAIGPRLGMVVTNDASPFAPDDTAVNPSGGALVELDVNRAQEYDRPFEHAFLGTGPGNEVASLGRITRVCSTVDGEPSAAAIPDGELLVTEVDRFETLLVLRARNANEPKRDFAS